MQILFLIRPYKIIVTKIKFTSYLVIKFHVDLIILNFKMNMMCVETENYLKNPNLHRNYFFASWYFNFKIILLFYHTKTSTECFCTLKMYDPKKPKILIVVRFYWTSCSFLHSSFFQISHIKQQHKQTRIRKLFAAQWPERMVALKRAFPNTWKAGVLKLTMNTLQILEVFESFFPIISTIWCSLLHSVR